MFDALASLSSPVSPTQSRPSSIPWPLLLVLYLGPGVCLTVFYVLVAPLLLAIGLPAIWGLLIGTLVVIVPLEGGTLLYLRRQNARQTPGGVHIPASPTGGGFWFVVLAVVLAFLLPGINLPLEPWFRTTFFAWLPSWFSAGLTTLPSYSLPVQGLTLGLWFVSVVIIGPIVEELYFRGFLLPRTAHNGRMAPLLNALLFAVYHFWQPYAVVTIVLFALPLAYLVWWRKNVVLSIVAHCTINLIAFIALTAGIVQR